MIDRPQIIDISPARTTAVVRVCCPREELSCTMGRGVRELLDRIKIQGAQTTGPLFMHHLRGPTDSFDCEVGVAVDHPVHPSGHVHPGQWPAMRVAHALYRGRYEYLPQAWAALRAWIALQGLVSTGEQWECYITGPEIGSDASAWRTELYLPLCGAGA
ncbi:MAG: GyrI-like domain-containing protein [Proteobacteria bacterium]|nr:GyrI-like domain-containing protein [Pseudomonadota bacterium]MBS0301807.1 GyrI-like domain-containing protein [Pseudomonadota bacterium]